MTIDDKNPDFETQGEAGQGEAAMAPETLESRIAELELAVVQANDERLRAMAEAENVKKRLTREKEQFCEYANEKLLGDIIPALDNLDMALAYAPADPAAKSFVDGVRMTRKMLLDSLKAHGLVAMGGVGDEFDPQWHEAVGYEETKDVAQGRVCKLMQQGYQLKGRLLRPARVLVSKPC